MPLLFFEQLRETLANFDKFWHTCDISKELDANDCGFDHLILTLSLH